MSSISHSPYATALQPSFIVIDPTSRQGSDSGIQTSEGGTSTPITTTHTPLHDTLGRGPSVSVQSQELGTSTDQSITEGLHPLLIHLDRQLREARERRMREYNNLENTKPCPPPLPTSSPDTNRSSFNELPSPSVGENSPSSTHSPTPTQRNTDPNTVPPSPLNRLTYLDVIPIIIERGSTAQLNPREGGPETQPSICRF